METKIFLRRKLGNAKTVIFRVKKNLLKKDKLNKNEKEILNLIEKWEFFDRFSK